MLRWSYLPGATVLVLLASLGSGMAQTTAEVAARWGVLGTWRVDCNGPASQSNWLISYVVRAGVVYQDRDWGEGPHSSQLTSASIKPDGSLEVVIPYQSETLQITWVRDGNRKRAVNTRVLGTGDYRIRDGKFTSTGKPAPWQYRCS